MLSLIERGEGNPSWSTVEGIAAALGVSVAKLAKLAEGRLSRRRSGLDLRPRCDHDAPERLGIARKAPER